jgi:hypothetical protein
MSAVFSAGLGYSTTLMRVLQMQAVEKRLQKAKQTGTMLEFEQNVVGINSFEAAKTLCESIVVGINTSSKPWRRRRTKSCCRSLHQAAIISTSPRHFLNVRNSLLQPSVLIFQSMKIIYVLLFVTTHLISFFAV